MNPPLQLLSANNHPKAKGMDSIQWSLQFLVSSFEPQLLHFCISPFLILWELNPANFLRVDIVSKGQAPINETNDEPQMEGMGDIVCKHNDNNNNEFNNQNMGGMGE